MKRKSFLIQIALIKYNKPPMREEKTSTPYTLCINFERERLTPSNNENDDQYNQLNSGLLYIEYLTR